MIVGNATSPDSKMIMGNGRDDALGVSRPV
jgi:hypothetical protein